MFSRPFSHRRLTVASPLLALLLLMTVQAMAATNPYRWYYHNATKNETSAALTAAIQNKCGLLVFVGKPNCHICEAVWSSSYDGTAMMDGTGKMATYLKNNKLVGLKIEDSQSHFSDLASGAMGYRNSDNSATNTNAPFLVLVKVKEGKESDENFDLTSRKSDIEVFFGGYGSLVMYDKTYAKITAWLNGLMASDKYKTACPGVSEPVGGGGEGDSGSGSGSGDSGSGSGSGDSGSGSGSGDSGSGSGSGDSGSGSGSGDGGSGGGSSTPTISDPFRWFYHTSTKNETNMALTAALENDCGLLVFVGKPGCHICEAVWSSSYNGTAMMDGTGKMATYLKNKKLVGLKIEDSQSHFSDLASGAMGYRNANGTATNTNAPFLVLVKVKAGKENDDNFDLTSRKSDIEVFFGGYGSLTMTDKTYAKITAWLDNLLASDQYKAACTGKPSGGSGSSSGGSGSSSGGSGSGDSGSGSGSGDSGSGSGSGDSGSGSSSGTVSDPFRWFYHTSTKNETSMALTAALETQCGLLVFVGKPGCHICEAVWSSSYDGTAMMDGTGKMAAYLKSHSLVGLKIEDSQSHFSDLASGAMGYRNSDGSATNTNAPFLVLVQVKEGKENDENFDLTSRNSDIEYFFGGYGSLVMYDKTYAKITAWLNGLLATDEYKTRCPGDLSPALESPNPLEFFEADPAYLGTDDAGQLITANAVGKAPTSLSSSKKELYYKFHAETGRRYLFTVTAASSIGAPTLAELVAKKLQLTCAVLSIGTSGAPSATAVAEKSNATYGFRVLDEGFFFVPEESADYYLKISTTTKLSAAVPFTLRYSYTELGTAGSLGTPLWKGVEAGKWSMDYDAAVEWSVTNAKPFLLYFCGCTWCPSCVSFEHLVVETAGFKGATKNLPIVMLDNRRRGEVTGPTLLYAPDYQEYAGFTDDEAAAKLVANKAIQTELGKRVGKDRVNYPSLLLCQGKNDGSVRVFSRVDLESDYPYGIFHSPEKTDFNAFGKTFVENLIALQDDPYEENDNWAQNAEQAERIQLGKEQAELRDGEMVQTIYIPAKIGGYDTVDWRAVEFTEKYSCLFKLEGNFDDNAFVTLGIYDTLGTGAKDGNLRQQVTGTGAELPQLEFRAAGPGGYRLKVQVEGQVAPVEYSVVATAAELPPYDIGLDATVYHVRRGTGRTAMAELKAPWKRMEATTLTGEVALDIEDGVGQCDSLLTFGNGGQEASGTLELDITALPLPSKDSVVPKEIKVALESVANCRVTENAEAVIRIYALPAFGTYANGDTMNLKLSQDLDLPANGLAIPFVNGLTDDTDFAIVSGTLPAGLKLAIQNDADKPGFGKLVLTGKPTEAITTAQVVTVQLKTSDGEAGATLKFAFTVEPLSKVNPVADTTNAYTGYIVSSEDGVVFGTFTLDRQADRSIKVSASFIDMEPVTGVAPAWTALETGDVYTELDLDGELLVLMVLTDGTGFGWFEDSELEDCYLSFTPNMPSATARAEYAGFYNVAFESTHPDYQGFGWMTLNINTSGKVAIQGVTPDGVPFTNTTNLVEENGVGVFTIVTYNPDGQDYASGRIQITPRSVREDGMPCVSACSSAMGIFWYDLASDIISHLMPCGTEYDTSAQQTFMGQIQQGDEKYENLYFYAISLPKILDVPASYPAGICPQLLPAVEIEEGNRSFEIKESAYEGLNGAPFDALNFKLKFTDKGKMTGSFQAFDISTAEARELKFEGVLTPIPAACCGGDTYALGYGSIFSATEAKSWPVRITPVKPDEVNELVTGAPVVEEITPNTLTVSGVAEINRKLSAYVILDDQGVPRAFAAANPDTGKGVIDWADLALPAGSQVAVVVNGLISAGTEVLKTEIADFEIPLNNDDKFEEDDPEDAFKGWRIYAMPTTFMLAEAVPVDKLLTVYAYPANGKSPVRIEDWSELLPGQAFWVYVDKKSLGTASTLVSVQGVSVFNVKIQVIEPIPGQFVFSVAPAELPKGADFWKWTGELFQKDTDGAGWLRVPKTE